MTTATWLGNPAHSRWLEQETDALLEFARGSRTDQGFGYLDADGRVDPARGSELWLTCRMTHVFALGALLGRPGCAPLVDHGLQALTEVFADPEHGGWFAAVGPHGATAERKEAYPHAFVLLATSSATAAGRPGADRLLARAQAVSLEHFWREDEGMVVEGWDRTFTECEDYRGVNANMHTVEAYLATADVTGDDAWLDMAVRIVERVVDGFARGSSWRIPEHFTPDWAPLPEYNKDEPAHPFRPFGATVGHWFEWARLTLQARDALTRRGRAAGEWMLDGARQLFAAGAAEGWAVDGADGFVYTVDFDGIPVVRERMHWVVTEAVAAAAALHRATGETEYDDWYRTWWDHAAVHHIERPGAWIHELSPTNGPSAKTWSGKPDVYHALQATLIPRLPLSPALSAALVRGLVDL
ncbi:AGE family epimerase/isomerase [Georgenia subflava]|uniref:AGE family epimerase/isomerase n=1 Tax=Georgenia subflava TaxID=1622177 RepID=A0A6N7EFW8_9MICO|nr:AGE family epimerase/isomerase [Georgenia subflava]MPV35575.1 AGE family epimerase/isomerase [Georgenia subflava]